MKLAKLNLFASLHFDTSSERLLIVSVLLDMIILYFSARQRLHFLLYVAVRFLLFRDFPAELVYLRLVLYLPYQLGYSVLFLCFSFLNEVS